MNVSNDLVTASAVPGLLRELESRLDQTYAALCDLSGALPRARLEVKFSAVVGQSILRQISHAGSTLIEARGQVVAVHRLLEKLALHAGIEVATGDERPKPPMPTEGSLDAAEIATIGAVA